MTGVSIIIRTMNEAKCLEVVLTKIATQTGGFQTEIIIIDSDSTDGTLDVAARFNYRVIQLPRSEFSWGRALNMGLEAAANEYCVLLSGHCTPVTNKWLDELVRPLSSPSVAATCGRQVPRHGMDPFEEAEIERWFPALSENTSCLMFTSAASAIKRSLWQACPFNEIINSLEDAEVSARLKKAGYDIQYVPAAAVYHSHLISVPGIYRRWYWRSRVGMFLRQDVNPRIKKSSRSVWPYIAPLETVFVSASRYFFKGIKICLTRSYITQLWKLPVYELIREYAIFTGVRDGLFDVKSKHAPGRFEYYQKRVPRFINRLRFIEK
jgi:glycosyltransferase involved in cell wall biosynthesis